MSKLTGPSSSMRLPQPSRLRVPGAAFKREATEGDFISSPKKRTRQNSSTDSEGLDASMQPPPGRAVPPTRGKAPPRLQKSVSMANLASSTQRSRPGLTNMGTSTVNLTGRPSSVSARVTTGRRPGSNITNRVNNSITTSRGSLSATTKPSTNGEVTTNKAKTKRPIWDLKGRVQDMEATMSSYKVERENFNTMLSTYDTRIESLEQEKQSLNQNLEKTQTASQANQEEVDRLTLNLKQEQSERTQEKRRLQTQIEDLEFKEQSLSRKVKSQESVISSKEDEVDGLKSTISQITSKSAGMEAQLSSTKMLLEDSSRKVVDLEALVTQMKNTIATMEHKLTEEYKIRKKLHNQVQELKGNIRVFCRVRPLIGEEIKNNGDTDEIHHISFIDEKTLEVCKSGDPNGSSMSGLKGRGNGNYEFNYDRVFDPQATQAEVFEEISQLAQSALDGYNVCVFAYGQTGSGKTFTMEGVHDNLKLEGMIPRTVRQIFKSMKELEDKGWTYKLEASFLEIYNESIRDLLVSSKEAKPPNYYEVKLLDNKKNETYVTNLKVQTVRDEAQVQTLLKAAQQNRAVASTNMNERSSRSHSVFRLKLIGENNKTSECCEGTLNLVDLAGSERLKESGSEGARLTETQNINKSLSNLGNVIMALGQKAGHIPYRNSKLTHLLQSCLGGNSKSLMFINVSPLDMCFNETLNSLRFATKVNQCHIGTATKQVRK